MCIFQGKLGRKQLTLLCCSGGLNIVGDGGAHDTGHLRMSVTETRSARMMAILMSPCVYIAGLRLPATFATYREIRQKEDGDSAGNGSHLVSLFEGWCGGQMNAPTM